MNAPTMDKLRTHALENEVNWRTDLMREALRAMGRGNDAATTMLAGIHRNLPENSTVMVWADRDRMAEFLQSECTDSVSVISGTMLYCDIEDEEATRPYASWHRAVWQEHEIEVAVRPYWSQSGTVLISTANPEVLKRLILAISDFMERMSCRVMVYSNEWKADHEMAEEMSAVQWEDVILAPETMQTIRNSVDGFFDHREAYSRLGFAWRRGLLMVGPPGTGKTMVCKAIAASRPEVPFLYVRQLEDGEHEDAITSIFKRARKVAPCILAFEDLDGFVTEGNRTRFLNELDGFRNNEGLFIVASSNHPGKIDTALLRRPSRFDRVVAIGLPKLAERREYCLRILRNSELMESLASDFDLEGFAAKVAERTSGFTPAYIKEAILGGALQRAREGAMVLDNAFADAVLTQVRELKAHLKSTAPDDYADALGGSGDAIGLVRRDRS